MNELNLEFRTIDGTNNHQFDLGATGDELLRLFDNAYEDGISEPRGGDFITSTLPNPRTISNTVSNQTESVPNFLGASDWLWQWGQFIDHDLDLNEAGEEIPPEDFTPIIVPNGDPTFSDGSILPFIRVSAAEGTGTSPSNPREAINEITSFIDASSVYGSDDERAEFLRSFENGQLQVSEGNNGETLLVVNPTGDDALPNAGGGVLGNEDFQFVAGDIRANEQIGLIAVHTLFVREHNRLATDLYERLEAGETELVDAFDAFAATSDETDVAVLRDEFIYQSARKVVGAQIQKITYDEFLPILIGENTLDPYSGYDPTVIPNVSTEFANAAYRLGHTLLSEQLKLLGDNALDEVSLADSFFTPETVQEDGVDSALRGLILQESQELDNLVVDGVRNFLFPAGTGGFDLASVNIARGRDTGLPGYVEVYNQLFPDSPITSFEDLPFREGLGGDDGLFAEVYNDVSEIDLWIGGISEAPDAHGGLLGPTFSFIIADQFGRARDGDRFFYESELEELELLDPDFADTTLSEVIRNNTDNPFLVQDNAFEVPFENAISGSDTNNTLNGTNLADLIEGGAGNDRIRGRNGADILLGDEGNDDIRGGNDDDTILGGLGNDYIRGNRGDDVLLGGDDDDTLRGASGDDTILGGNGDDSIVGGSGDDVLNGVGDELGANDFDRLQGNGGQNSFILGEAGDMFYEGSGFATIVNFRQNLDTVQLVGSADDYDLTVVSGDTELSVAGSSDVIAVFENKAIANFNNGFSFV